MPNDELSLHSNGSGFPRLCVLPLDPCTSPPADTSKDAMRIDSTVETHYFTRNLHLRNQCALDPRADPFPSVWKHPGNVRHSYRKHTDDN